jgi:hypothetical protein
MASAVNVRKGHRADVTRRLGLLPAVLVEGDEARLSSFRAVLQEKLVRLQALDERILEEITDEEAIGVEISAATDVEMLITEGINRIMLRVKTEVESVRSEDSMTGAASRSHARVRLPKIELQRFSGDPGRYQEWWDSYESMVHLNQDLAEIDKFNYLKSSVTGSAKAAILGMSTTTANYKNAIDIIQDRFGKKAVVVASHMDSLMNLPIITSSRDITKLRVLYDKVEMNVRSLNALGIESTAYGALLVPVVLRSLPEDIQMRLSRKFVSNNEVWELDSLLEAFKAEVEAKERCSAMSGRNSVDKNADSSKGSGYNGRPDRRNTQHSTMQHSMTMNAQDGKCQEAREECAFCKRAHPSKNCRTVTDVNSRRQIVREEGRCYLCLGMQHRAATCKSGGKCAKCSQRHHSSICYGVKPKTQQQQQQPLVSQPPPGDHIALPVQQIASQVQQEPQGSGMSGSEENSTLLVDGRQHTLLETAKVTASSVEGGCRVRGRIILDKCSHRSFITDRFRQKLRLKKLASEPMNVRGFGGKNTSFEKVDVVQVRICCADEEDVVVTVSVVPTICLPPSSEAVKFAKNRYEHLSTLELADDPDDHSADNEISMLIGADHYWSIMLDGIRRGDGGPVAQESRCGWILSGPLGHAVPNVTDQSLLIQADPIAEVLSRFWETESLGISSTEENDVHDQLRDTITFKDGRYEVGLPWKDKVPGMADNYQQAEKRLSSVITKLRKDPELLSEYDKVMRSQVEGGILEEVGEARPAAGMSYYMPHLPVVRKDKETTKLRVVYDASSKTLGRSLNQNLHQGPCLLPQLFKILLRFRMHRIGIVADIEKAFLSIGVQEKDRDFLRMLWVKDPSQEQLLPWVLRFTRVVFGLCSSPFHLNATLQYHLQRYEDIYPKTVHEILQSLYVDDMTSGADSEEEGVQLYREAKVMLAAAGMNLRKWASNSDALMARIDEEEEQAVVEAVGTVTPDDSTYAKLQTETYATIEAQQLKVLGVVWDRAQDEWLFDLRKLCEEKEQLTKRRLLGRVASMYDPMGLISPLILPLKLTFQSMCGDGVKWDSAVSDEVQRIWDGWAKDICTIPIFSFPRCCLPGY